MTVAEALPTMTDAEKVKAFDYWYSLTKKSNPGLSETMEVEKGSYWHPAEAIAHVIADRKPDLAPWTPEDGVEVWSSNGSGQVYSALCVSKDAEPFFNFGNVFRTREEAEAHAARLRVFNRVFQMRAALGMMNLSPWDVMRFLTDSLDSNEADAIREQLGKEGTL